MTELIEHLGNVIRHGDITRVDIPFVTKKLNDTRIYNFQYHRDMTNIAMHAVAMIITKIESDYPIEINADFILISPFIKKWLNIPEDWEHQSDNFKELIKRVIRYSYRLTAMSAISGVTPERQRLIDPAYFGLESKFKFFETDELYGELYDFAVMMLIQLADLVKEDIELMQWTAVFYRYMFCDVLDFNKEFSIKSVVPIDGSGIDKLTGTWSNTLAVIMATESEAFDVYDATNDLCKQNIYDSAYYIDYKNDPVGWMLKECSTDNSDITKAMHSKHGHFSNVWNKYLTIMDDYISELSTLIKEPNIEKLEISSGCDGVMQHMMLRNIILLIILDKWFARKYNFKTFMKKYVIRKADEEPQLFHRLLLMRDPVLYEYAPFQWGILHKFVLHTHWDMNVLISEWYKIIRTTLYNKLIPGPDEVIYIKDFLKMSTQITAKVFREVGTVKKKIKMNDYKDFMALLDKHQ